MLYFCDPDIDASIFRISSEQNNIYNKSYGQLLIIQANIDSNRQDHDEKMKKQYSKFDNITEMIKKMMDHIQVSNSLPYKMDSPKAQDTTTVFLANKKSPPFEGAHYTKIGGMWTLKHGISSLKFYELLINVEFKGCTALDLKNFYNHIKTFLNAVTIL